MPINREILSKLLAQLPQPEPHLKHLHIFLHWVIANCNRPGMATLFRPPDTGETCYESSYLGDLIGKPVTEIAETFADSTDPLRLALVKSCLNGSLPLPRDLFEANAVDPFADMIKQCPSCFIGHFNQAEIWRDQGHPVTIIELQPRPGDIHWNDSRPALREAEIVFITGLTLINGTFLEVLTRTPRAKYRVLLGPTVPCNPLFFDYGVHLIGSTLIADFGLTIRYCQHGGTTVRKAPTGALRRVNLTNRPELKAELTRLTRQTLPSQP
ncbi:MAG TPA: DUF364 domain-containing protein [Verrucomicrobiae bacterium]|nr:DUF364 domain-containing protein [Verrucomicrobiae bacterium]